MGDAKDSCGACMERKCGYENQIRELHKKESSASKGWSFWRDSSKDDCACGGGEAKPKVDECKPKVDECKPKVDECKPKNDPCADKGKNQCAPDDTCYKQPSGQCPPMPSSNVPALCMPAWLTCPPRITVPPYPAPAGVEIRPISEGGRNSKCEGGKCGKCGMDRPAAGPPKVSANCPMVKPKCPNAKADKGKAKDEGFLSKIASALGLGGKKEAKK